MVFDYALCAVNLASTAVANGLCCLYQMKKEEARNQEMAVVLRQTIRSEWGHYRHTGISKRVKETKRHAYEQGDERRIGQVEAEYMTSRGVDHSQVVVTSSLDEFECRQSPACRDPSEESCPNLWHNRCNQGSCSRIGQNNRAFQPRGEAHISRQSLSNVESLLDDSDDENEPFASAICTE
jgi:hypothetical protein